MLLTNQKTINYEKFIFTKTGLRRPDFVGAKIVIIPHHITFVLGLTKV